MSVKFAAKCAVTRTFSWSPLREERKREGRIPDSETLRDLRRSVLLSRDTRPWSQMEPGLSKYFAELTRLVHGVSKDAS